MSFGFLAKNQFGYTQVDGVYQNISGIYSGSILCNEYRVLEAQTGAGTIQPARSELTHSTSGRSFSVSSISNFPSGADFLVFAKPSSSAASGTRNIGIYWLSATSFIFVKESVDWDVNQVAPNVPDTSFSVVDGASGLLHTAALILSYMMNLQAVSGAILIIFVPFPLKKPLVPPSL